MNTFASTIGSISSVKDIEALAGAQLVAVHNELTGLTVKKFADKKSGIARTIKAFQTWNSQQKAAGPQPEVVTPEEHRSYRPDSNRGKVIELASKAGGAKFGDLKQATKWDDAELKAALARIKGYNGLTVVVTGEGDETVVTVSGVLRTRKAFAFEPLKEQKPHKPNTKRAKVLEMLLSGATFVQIQEATKWDDRTAYEGIRLIHGYLGYGLVEGPDGVIKAYAKAG